MHVPSNLSCDICLVGVVMSSDAPRPLVVSDAICDVTVDGVLLDIRNYDVISLFAGVMDYV